MHFDRLQSSSHSLYEQSMELYEASFPLFERRDLDAQKRILKHENYNFNLIYDKNIFVGIMLYWETEDFIYLEHFCINPNMRNKKYGERALQLLNEKCKPIILEIDPPVDNITNRRKNFYERNGYVKNDFYHLQLPYHKGDSKTHLVIMSFPNKLSQEFYDYFYDYLETTVMKDIS